MKNKEYIDFKIAPYALPKVCETLYRNGIKDACITQEDDDLHIRWEYKANRSFNYNNDESLITRLSLKDLSNAAVGDVFKIHVRDGYKTDKEWVINNNLIEITRIEEYVHPLNMAPMVRLYATCITNDKSGSFLIGDLSKSVYDGFFTCTETNMDYWFEQMEYNNGGELNYIGHETSGSN